MISICAPYWDRQAALDQMIRCYREQYAGLPHEISICDDGSPVPAVAPGCILTRLAAKAKPLNPCVPINRAVAASSGDVVVLTNPEIEHRSPVLKEMLALLDGPHDYISAQCQHLGRSNNGIWLSGPQSATTGRGLSIIPPGGQLHFLVMFRRELWEKAGGFDEDYRHGTACDDNDWLWRVYAAGAIFKQAQGVVWHHRDRRTAWGMPHNNGRFLQKWPPARRAALVKARG